MIWTFNQLGTIPGVPGEFAGVRVDVDDATNTVRSVTPLGMHAEFVATPIEEKPVDQAKDATPAPEPVPTPDAVASVEAQP